VACGGVVGFQLATNHWSLATDFGAARAASALYAVRLRVAKRRPAAGSGLAGVWWAYS